MRLFRMIIIRLRPACTVATRLFCTRVKSAVGLEVHAQISESSSKLFSSSGSSSVGINNKVSFHDAGMPGTLPVLNRNCVIAAVKTALSLSCDINLISEFDRKHYYYADMPAGYQITQQRKPIAQNGAFEFVVHDASTSEDRIVFTSLSRINKIQLEQDSGRSLLIAKEPFSRIDLNRAGVALLEIVTEPDFCNGSEASSFVHDLRYLLKHIGVCDGDMSQGKLRVDASVSMRNRDGGLGVRTEIKNMNSIRSVKRAVDYEIQRQSKILEEGGHVLNETRAYDKFDNITLLVRDKEKLHDYRFMPEPNLLPLELKSDFVYGDIEGISIKRIQDSLPELPQRTRDRLVEVYGLVEFQAYRISMLPEVVQLLDSIHSRINLKPGTNSETMIDWLLTSHTDCPQPLNSERARDVLSGLMPLVQRNQIEPNYAWTVVQRALSVQAFDLEEELFRFSENNQDKQLILDDMLKELIASNPAVLTSYVRAKDRKKNRIVSNYFVKRVLADGGGKWNENEIDMRCKQILDVAIKDI